MDAESIIAELKLCKEALNRIEATISDEPGDQCERVKLLVCQRFQISRRDLMGRSREERVAWPRQVAMFLARDMGFTWHEVGRAFNRDHGTAISGCERVKDRIDTEPAVASLVAVLRGKLMSSQNYTFADLQANARRAWPQMTGPGNEPPNIWTLVECLTNVAVNAQNKVKELEEKLKG
jgi:hypothetical protein